MQLFGKLDELINQLTSDEPKENVDASPAMLARQEQLRDAILSAAEQMQKESRTLLEELGKVGSSLVFTCILHFFCHSDEKSLSFPIIIIYFTHNRLQMATYVCMFHCRKGISKKGSLILNEGKKILFYFWSIMSWTRLL